jgi:uncharacterized membrane protein
MHLLRLSTLLMALLLPGPATLAGESPATPPVQALLFFSDQGCPTCSDLFELYAPALLERLGPRLQLAAVAVAPGTGEALYQAAARVYGLAPTWPGVPLALVGKRVLRGLDQIGGTLGDDLDTLSRDPASHAWPALPGLAAALPGALQEVQRRVARAAPLPPLPETSAGGKRRLADHLANGLAVAVLLGMLGTLGGALWRVGRGRRRAPPRTGWIWLALALGLVISSYTAYTSLEDLAPVCGPIGDCAAVQHSEYAQIFGIPMGVLGLLGYGAILVTWLAGRRLTPQGGGWRWLPWAIALAGTLFSVRLTALEPFVIGATCMWCLGSAVTISALLWMLSAETRRV